MVYTPNSCTTIYFSPFRYIATTYIGPLGAIQLGPQNNDNTICQLETREIKIKIKYYAYIRFGFGYAASVINWTVRIK